MMGPQTLAEMREELWQKLAETGSDPIEWLDKRIAARKRKGQTTDVYEAVKHVLERRPKKAPGQKGGLASNGEPKTAGKRPDVLAELEAVTRALEQEAAKKKARKRTAKAKA
jgi:hypothetical protein